MAVSRYRESAKEWFPRWIKRLYSFSTTPTGDDLPLSRDLTIEFSRQLLRNGVPAWQRLQAVKAVITYRNLVLKASEPALDDMCVTLQRIVESEREAQPGLKDEAQLVGWNH